MARFTDNLGRGWTIQIDVALIESIKADCGIDMLRMIDGELTNVLTADLRATASALFLACRPTGIERTRRLICDTIASLVPNRIGRWLERRAARSFMRGLAGDGFERAMDCLVEAMIDFFPNARRRTVLRATWNWTKELDASVSSSLLSHQSSQQTIAAG